MAGLFVIKKYRRRGIGRQAAKSNRDDDRAELFRDLLSEQPSIACSQVVVVGVTGAPGAGIGRDAVTEQDECVARHGQEVTEKQRVRLGEFCDPRPP